MLGDQKNIFEKNKIDITKNINAGKYNTNSFELIAPQGDNPDLSGQF